MTLWNHITKEYQLKTLTLNPKHNQIDQLWKYIKYISFSEMNMSLCSKDCRGNLDKWCKPAKGSHYFLPNTCHMAPYTSNSIQTQASSWLTIKDGSGPQAVLRRQPQDVICWYCRCWGGVAVTLYVLNGSTCPPMLMVGRASQWLTLSLWWGISMATC